MAVTPREGTLVNEPDWDARSLVGLLAAICVVALIVGLLLGRYLLPASKAPVARSPVEPVGSARPDAEASTAVVAKPSDSGTSQPGTNPPQTPATATPAGRGLPGMPTRTNEFGIPVGYPHTEAGAISACGNYVAAYSFARNREPSHIHAVLTSISETAAASKLADRIIEVDKKNATSFGATSINDPKISFNSRILGFEVQQKTLDAVTVSIWSSASFGAYENADVNLLPQVRWGTDTCVVHWLGDDWKIVDANDGPGGPFITERAAEGYQRFTYVGGPGS